MLLLNLILIHVVLILIILVDDIQGSISIDNLLCNFNILLVKGKLIGLLPKLDKEFLVSFDVYPNKFVAGYHSVIHLTIGSNFGKYGDRVPGIWFNNRGDGSIYISAPISGDINKVFITNPIKLNKWSNVKVGQVLKNSNYVYTIRLNGEVVFTYINNNAQSFNNVKVYASDPWHDVQDGLIRNLFIINGNGLQPIIVLPTVIDECANLIDYCNWANSDCVNTNGSYYFTCMCAAYYFIYCNWANSDCLNTNGIFYFTCKSGWRLKNNSCVDIDECTNLTGYCNWENSDCVNTNGSYYCTCKSGWRLNNNSCVDVNECKELAKYCNLTNSDCVNTNGSYNCTCKSGWRLENNSCVDVNECNELAKYCNFTNSDCVNTNGSYKCTCKAGWIFENNSCVDLCQMINYIIEDIPTPLKKAKNITKMQILDTEFIISFDFIPYSFSNNLSSIIHFIDDSNIIRNGYPGVWLDNTGVLQVSALINGTGFIFRNYALPLNQWSKIKISQIFSNGNYLYRIQVNNVYIISLINTQVQSFKNVIVYASNPWDVSQNGSIKNLFVANNQAVLSSSLLQWSNLSTCNTSNGYGFTNRTRYLADECYTEQKQCYVYKAPLWNVFNTVSVQGNLILLNLQIYPTFIKPSNVSLEFEYFLPPFFTFISDSIIQRFVKTQANRLRYSFNGNFTYLDSFNYSFTATYNNSLCPISGVFILEILLMLSLQVEAEKRERVVKTFQKQVECSNNLKIPVSQNQQLLKESYGQGIYWDEYNNHIYVCMSQHYPSTKPVCYFSDDEGYLWTAMDVQVGSVLGRHSVTKELYAVHRNRKMYLMFHNYYKKWLAITNQQFLNNVFNQLNSTFVKNLEGDNEQIYTLGPYQWLGNAEGLFFRRLKSDSWIQRVKWIL
ncbi:uncharacterized protein LOC136080664 isoform X2 [Hydra vulgaris]|uniref:Uncharacterized protein LOC136080664 isoform X2 n=1 Tax=Hydra vulgaris TaxID=6087 RepID=A0ABM4BWS3_HYDVU